MASLGTVSWILAIPTGAMMAGGLFVYLHELGAKQIAGMQHFASGILLAAVAYEIVPQLTGETHGDKGAFIGGFLLGAGLLMFISRYDFKHWQFAQCIKNREQKLVIHKAADEEAPDPWALAPTSPSLQGSESPLKDMTNVKKDFAEETSKEDLTEADFTTPGSIPKGLVLAVMLDGSIDGFLIGLSYISGGAAGLITAIALALEMTLLGISTISTLRKRKVSNWKIFFCVFFLPLPIFGVGLLGCTVFRGLEGPWLVGVSSFGAAGLLYLVSEELLIEAHSEEETDRWYVSFMFFLGFLLVGILGEYAPKDL